MFESDTPVKNSRSHMLNSSCQSRLESERMAYIRNRQKDLRSPTRGVIAPNMTRGVTSSKQTFGYQRSSLDSHMYNENTETNTKDFSLGGLICITLVYIVYRYF